MKLLSAVLIAAVSMSSAASAQVRFALAFGGFVDCETPIAVRGVPFSGSGEAVLRPDGGATLNMTLSSNFGTDTLRFDTALGRSSVAPGGVATLRVIGRSRLQSNWDLPNHTVGFDINANAKRCSMKVVARLRPGQSAFSVYTGSGFAYCSRLQFTAAACRAD